MEVGLTYMPTNILESINRLILTDAGGNLFELHPQCLKAINP